MSRPPSQNSPPSPGFPRSNPHTYQAPSPGHHSSQQYSHPSPGGHSYPHPHPGDPYHYPQTPHHSYIQAPGSPEYRQQRPPLPPPPHPPAPPAPPRPQSYRKTYQQPQEVPTSPRPNLVPTFNYYRAHAEYEAHHASPHSNPGLEQPGVPHLRVDTERRAGALRQDGSRARSASTASGYGSGMPEQFEGEMEATPSPVDPRRIQQWEEEHAPGQSQHVSSGSGSYRGENEDEVDTINQSFGGAHHEYYPPGSFAQGESSASDGRRAGYTDPGSAGLEMPYSQKRANSDYYPSPHHQAQFQALAQQTAGPVNTQRGNIGLNSLVDGEPGDRPAYPIPTIIKCAILGSPHQQLTLSELYLAMEMRFDYYKNSDKKSWRNSVRHNLSLNNQFDKKERPITEPGKGHYWVVVPDMPRGNKRERKRNKKPGKRALAATEAERFASERHGGGESVDSRMNPTEVPFDSHVSATTVVYPAAVRGYTTRTLPANAGSYAAVTGALPAPPPLDRQLFRPWDGDAPSSHPERSGPAEIVQGHKSPSIAHSNHGLRSPTGDAPERRPTQPQFGESSLRPGGFASPVRRHEGLPSIPSDSVSTKSSSSASGHGTHRSPTMRPRQRYDPTAPVTAAPQNAFSELAAQIAREGIGARGSGGPALTGRGKRSRGKGRARDDNWDSDDFSDDDEYLPHKTRIRRR